MKKFNFVCGALNKMFRHSFLTSGLAAVLFLAAACQSTTHHSAADAAMSSQVRTKESQSAMSPDAALAELRAGNARFVAGQSRARDFAAEVRATASHQYPFAVILSCLDSRQPIEIVFDQGIGDVFSARVAGNVINDDILGSMEFACNVSGARLIAVIGHSNCGAIKGAIDEVQLGNLTGLLAKIKPAIAKAGGGGEANSKNKEFVQKVAEGNVHLAMQQIRDRSPVLREMIAAGKIGLVGGMYDLSTGRVEFFPQ
jgi:carbonic anhydrase